MARRPLQPPRHPAALGALRRAGRALVGLAAAILLLALLAGVPYGLARWVGWPLPHHVPTLAEIKATLTGPFTDRILLDTLACLCWLVWAVFVADTIRAIPEAIDRARGAGMRRRSLTLDHGDGRRAGPLRGLAAVLLAAIVVGLLSLRPHPAVLAGSDSASVRASPTVVATSVQVAADRAARTNTVIVQAPRDGIHDSLWRIAARCLDDGARWPEIYRLNYGLPQPDGGTLTRPSLIQPGWVLRLPTTAPRGGSGGSSQHAPPSSTRPRTPYTRTPSAAPTTPTPTTAPATPAPTPRDSPAPTSPAPVSPGASAPPVSSRSVPPRPVDRPAVHVTGRSGVVEVGDGALVGLGLAGAVSAALLVSRRRRRRFYVPGSGRRDDLLPIAPVVRTLHLAHLRAIAETATSTEADGDVDGDVDTNVDAEANVDVEAERADSHPPPDRTGRDTDTDGDGDGDVKLAHSRRQASRGRAMRGVAPGNEASPSVPAGVTDGQEVAVDLVGLHGVGLVGAGAAGAARALILHLIAATASGRTQHEAPVVLVPAGTAAAVELPDPGRCPARLRLVADLAGALDAAETEMLRHARLATTDSTDPTHRGTAGRLGLVVVTAVPADTRRLQAILDAGTEAGVAAILLGQWRPGTSLYVAADGTVTATSPGPGEPLRGARLFHLDALDTTELLDQLHAADPPTAQSVAAGGNQTVDVPVDGAERQSRLPEAPPRPDEPDVPEPSAVISPSARSAPSGSACSVPARSGGGVSTTAVAADTATAAGSADRTPVLSDSRKVAGSVQPTVLALTVLGPVRLTWSPPGPRASPVDGAADITGALSPRLRELLVLLAVHPDGITRDRLADVLWPDTSAERPFATLNTNLARLRRTIAAATGGRVPEIVLTSGDRHQLDPDIVQTDFRAFSDALSARRAASSDEQRATAYRQVVAAYRGELGEGLSAEWLETSREAVRRDAVDAATSLARLLVASDARAALELVETARAFDPYNEAIYRDIMRLQRRLGQSDAIERTLALLTTRLTELEETPGTETLALAQRLQSPPSEPAQPTR